MSDFFVSLHRKPKTSTIMKRIATNLFSLICAVFCLFSATGNPASAQDILYEIPGLTPDNAIVRHWNSDFDVIYSSNANRVHFTVVDYAGSTAYDISTAVFAPIKINDFEISDDNVYFCGTATVGAAVPIFGYFRIPDVIAGSVPINVYLLGAPCSSTFTQNTTESITDLLKIEVQQCPDGFHAYMIGRAYWTNAIAPPRCIVDFRHTNGVATCGFAQQHSGLFVYDDIAVTHNEVIAVGHKNGGGNLYLTNFGRPALAAQDVFSLSSGQYFGNAIGCTGTTMLDSAYLIEHLHDDLIAVVGFTGDATTSYETNLSIYNGSLNWVDQVIIPQGQPKYPLSLKELKYNKQKELLYLLQDMEYPFANTVNSVACAFQLSPMGNILNAWASYELGVEYYSLDQGYPDKHAIAVGQNPDMRLWSIRSAFMSTPCVAGDPLPYKQVSRTNADDIYKHFPCYFQPASSILPVQTATYSLKKICR